MTKGLAEVMTPEIRAKTLMCLDDYLRGELYDEAKNEFIQLEKDQTICLEHSLVSVSKWEAKWHIRGTGSD